MTPVSPVIPGLDPAKETTFGGSRAGQPQCLPVPALVNPTAEAVYIVSRYTFTPEEREWIARGADLFVTFLGGMPPHILQICNADPDNPHYSATALAWATRAKEAVMEAPCS
jgi:hypothetical protein